MLIRSISSGVEWATAKARACEVIRKKAFSLALGERAFESRIAGRWNPGGRMTAAATTGPASGPRPASSTPATLPKHLPNPPLLLGLRGPGWRLLSRRADIFFLGFRSLLGRDGDPLLPEPVLLLADPGLFPGYLAEEEELRPADVPPLLHDDSLDERGVQRERPLHAHSVGLLANLEGGGGTVEVKPDDDPLEVLDALLFPFPDPQVDAHRVPGLERREVAAKLRFFQFPEEIAHFPNPFPESVPFGKQD